VFHLRGVPDQPFTGTANHHAASMRFIRLMGQSGLKLHRSSAQGDTSGPSG